MQRSPANASLPEDMMVFMSRASFHSTQQPFCSIKHSPPLTSSVHTNSCSWVWRKGYLALGNRDDRLPRWVKVQEVENVSAWNCRTTEIWKFLKAGQTGEGLWARTVNQVARKFYFQFFTPLFPEFKYVCFYLIHIFNRSPHRRITSIFYNSVKKIHISLEVNNSHKQERQIFCHCV